MIKITKKLLNSRAYMLSEDGGWVTNGVWMFRRDEVDCPYAFTEQRPNTQNLLASIKWTELEAIELTDDLRRHPQVGYAAKWVASNGDLTVWTDELYTQMLKSYLLWASDPKNPIIITQTTEPPTCAEDILGMIMPVLA